MHIFVTVKSRKKENKVEKVDDLHFIVWTKELPVKGRANNAIMRLLASYFDISLSTILLKSGLTSKHKVFEIANRVL